MLSEAASSVPAASQRYAQSRSSQSEGAAVFCLHVLEGSNTAQIHKAIAHGVSSHVQEAVDNIFHRNLTHHGYQA